MSITIKNFNMQPKKLKKGHNYHYNQSSGLSTCITEQLQLQQYIIYVN